MEFRPQVNPGHYAKKYDSKRRFASYWHQAREIVDANPQNVLEIGIGSGFLSLYLRHCGISVTTFDHDPLLKPDIVGEIDKLPFPDRSFDVTAAFEVLEHIPYENVPQVLGEIKRVCRRSVVISLPDATRFLRFEFPIPQFFKVKKLITVPFFIAPEHKFDGKHYWEIGKRGSSLAKVTEDFKKAGYKLSRTYRVFENPRHRFFVFSI